MPYIKLPLRLLWAACIIFSTRSGFALTLEKVFIVSRVNEQGVTDTSAKIIVKEDKCILYLVIKAKENNRTVYFSEAQKIKIAGVETVCHKPSEYDRQIEINWYKVEPEMYHLDGKGHDPANPYFTWYTNAGAPGGRTDRRPLSPDKIRYQMNSLIAENNKWVIVADAHPTDVVHDIHHGLGTMRYCVAVSYRDSNGVVKKLESAGPGSYTNNGISNEVAKIVVQKDNSYLGCLTGYFNVPGVFGSYQAQVDNYVGVDCADLIVAGWNKYKKRTIPYTNVSGLRYSFTSKGLMKLILSDCYFDAEGTIYAKYDIQKNLTSEKKLITIDHNHIRIGDVVVFNYNPDKSDRSWDHVGILYADSSESGGPNGVLDKYDLILHCGPAEARINTFNYEGFVSFIEPTRFAILRWVE